MIQIKRNNYVDGQFIDVDDFKVEQNYVLDRLRSNSLNLGANGVIDLVGLKVIPDTIMVEPIIRSAVEVAIDPSPDINASNPQNFTLFPGNLGGSSIKLYTVFSTKTANVQRVDLRITRNNGMTEELDLIVRVQNLIDPTNPLSPLANTASLSEIQLSTLDIPEVESDEFLELDFSNESSGQGISVLPNSYYALVLEYRRPVGSTTDLRFFHGPLNQNSALDEDEFSWVLVGSSFTQGFQNSNGIFQEFQLYNRVYTSAVTVTPGQAHIAGNRVTVDPDQFRFLQVPDRRNVDGNGNFVSNYVVLRYAEVFTDPELVQSTRNTSNTRIKDSSSVVVLTQPQWDELISDELQQGLFLLLAVVNDSNIVSVFDKKTFSIPQNTTNLAFHDWLNPRNVTPIDEASLIQQARPTDFIFFVSNVPAQVPLTDAFGNVQRYSTTVRNELGEVIHRAGDPILDDIVRVVTNISLDNGNNTRTLELAVTSEVGTGREFRNYAATISNLSDNPFDDVFSFNFNTDQLAPNVVYNFVAFTRRGLPIFIQDYNRVIANLQTDGSIENIRNKTFTTFLDQTSRTIVINEDLQLGAFNPASDTPQPGVIQYVPTLIQNEVPTPVGVVLTEDVIPTTKTLLSSASFTFSPVPMVRADLITKIRTTDVEVQSAYDAGDIQILVDNGDGLGPVDITFSGLTDRDRGGNGAAILVQGDIDSSVQLDDAETFDVKTREFVGIDVETGEPFGGRDNTNNSAAFSPFGPAQVGGSSDIREFQVLARGFNGVVAPFSNAGFNDGDSVYIFINDRPALDNNGNAITFTFDSAGPTTVTIPTIFALGTKQYLREKQVFSIENTTSATPGTVLIDTGLDADEESRELGQVIFSDVEIPTSINTSAIVTIQYNGVETTEADIDYFKTKFKPIGTRDGFKISNTNVVSSIDEFISVPEAFALTANDNAQSVSPTTFKSVAIFVDGINITSLISPIGPKTIVADDGATLQPNQIAFDPTEGTIKFFKTVAIDGYTISEAPTDFTRLSVTYFKLDTKFIFNTVTDAFYDPKYDINNDGHIDEQDLNIFTRAFGTSLGDVNYLAAADFNNDGVIDDVDLSAFREHFGTVALGEPDYSDATTARLGAMLIVKDNNYLVQVNAVRAFSRSPDAIAPTGRTVIFLDDTTPVSQPGNYQVIFGFAAAMKLGFIQTEIETERPLLGRFNLNNIKMFETLDPTNTREITQVETNPLPNANNRFDSLLTFTPAVTSSSDFTIKAQWSEAGIAILDSADLIIPQKYELLDRKVYGPFKLQYLEADFDDDGTSISFTLKPTDATLADGSPDPTGTHINGIPLSELAFTVHLTVPNSDDTSSTIWSWHNIQPTGIDNKIKLEYNEQLFLEHRNKGKDGIEVLTPFGLGSSQVTLKPKYAGGHLENDLGNVSVIRSDAQSRFVVPHTHMSEREGGILTSESIRFDDILARLETGNMTDIVYKLLDIIEEQERQIELIRALEGVIRWDRGLTWDDPNTFWDSN